MRMILAAILAAAAAGPALAQQAADLPYLDDRSTPQAVVQSLYNAINRREFGRAWSYFSTPPAASLEDYAKGYEATESVRLVVGAPALEGAAGSTIYTLPVALAASGKDGEQVFAGCYTLRLANPALQEDGFRPMHIDKGRLAPSPAALSAALPASCPDDVELPPQNATVERARALYAAGRAETCRGATSTDEPPQVHDIRFHYASDAADQPERVATLVGFFCDRGAYNERRAYYLADDTGEIGALQFAVPELDIRYEDGSDNARLDSMHMIGMNTVADLVNAEFDPATLTLSSFAKWRGVGDASAVGTWIFRNGAFTLVKYEVDPTYDGEIEHTTVIDYDTGP